MAFECPRRSSPPSPMFDADTGCIATDPAPSARRRFRSKTGIENLPANEHAQETPHTPSPTRTTRRIQSGCAGSRPRLRDGMPGSPSQHIDITRAKWIPYIRNSGHDGGDFLFVKTRGITVTPKAPAQTASPPASTGPSNAAEILFWQSIQDSDSPPMFSAYLDQYPRGTFAQLARLKIEQLKQASPNSTQATAARPKDRLGGSVSSECLDDAA